MIYGFGDTHIPIDVSKLNSKNFPIQKNMTKKDYIIITGDFGAIWKNSRDKEELYWLRWLSERSFTTLFVDGNHENHPRLFSGIISPDVVSNENYIIERKFGGYVGKVFDSVYHLRRGEIYIINNKKFFIMGGATSIDKHLRKQFGKDATWWKEEEPNMSEYNYALDNLEKHNNSVDYILGHTGPKTILKNCFDKYSEYGSVERFFDHIIEYVNFKSFYFGHFHTDKIIDNKYYMMYEKPQIILR